MEPQGKAAKERWNHKERQRKSVDLHGRLGSIDGRLSLPVVEPRLLHLPDLRERPLPGGGGGACRETWTRVTTDYFRRVAQICMGHRVSTNAISV